MDKLSTDDRRLAVAYLDRTKSTAALGGQQVQAGVTLGQAIDNERAYDQAQAQQRLASRGQQEQQDQDRKSAEDRAAEVFAVTLVNKEILPADLSTGIRTEQATFTFEFHNAGSKEISDVTGTLHVADNFFGTELKVIPLDYAQPLEPGATDTWQVTVPLTPQATLDQRIRNTDLKQMVATLTPNQIAFADGTHVDFSTASAGS